VGVPEVGKVQRSRAAMEGCPAAIDTVCFVTTVFPDAQLCEQKVRGRGTQPLMRMQISGLALTIGSAVVQSILLRVVGSVALHNKAENCMHYAVILS